jgi:mannose-6-phosphate isomerase-like protein (cupin superfamily)
LPKDEMFFLISGELEFLDSDRTFLAKQGDFVMIPRGRRHCFKNVSTHAVKAIFLFPRWL